VLGRSAWNCSHSFASSWQSSLHISDGTVEYPA
jgi:hypothetical protein